MASTAASIMETDAMSMISSGPTTNLEHSADGTVKMQGSSLRALFNATRVMASEPSSILVDGGEDIGPLVTRLAWELVMHVRDEGITFREPLRPKPKPRPSFSSTSQAMSNEHDGDTTNEGKVVPNRKSKARLSISIIGSSGLNPATEKQPRKSSALGSLASPLLVAFGGGSSSKSRPATIIGVGARDDVPSNTLGITQAMTTAAAPNAPAANISVALESIIPATSKPPTQYLARTYTSLISPDFKPPTSFGGFISDRFAIRRGEGGGEGREPITDRYGFVYEVSSYDVLLLDRAVRAGNSAPGCLTGIKVADREESDEWGEEEDPPREFEVIRGSCNCVDGVRAGTPVEEDGAQKDATTAGHHEAASMISTSSSKYSGKRSAHSKSSSSQVLPLYAPLKVSSLDILPPTDDAALVPTHACPNTVHALLDRITDMHDKKQAKLKADWDVFLKSRRDMKPVKASATNVNATRSAASSGAAALLGLRSNGVEDDFEDSSFLLNFSQMGLSTSSSERKEFSKLVHAGIPLVYRAKVWLECSGALEMAEPGAFRDLLQDAEREGGIAVVEIEKDVGRTMPLNVFFGGDGVGVNKLRRVLRAYSR